MNNEYGWGLNNVIAFLAVIFLAIIITMMMYNRSIAELFGGKPDKTKAEETYQDLEEALKPATRAYLDNFYYKLLDDGESGRVTVKELEEDKILKAIIDVQDNKTRCSGYVEFAKNNGITSYDPYIKCGKNYETDGYTAKYDEAVKQK